MVSDVEDTGQQLVPIVIDLGSTDVEPTPTDEAWGMQPKLGMKHGQPGSCKRCSYGVLSITTNFPKVIGFTPKAPPRSGNTVADGALVEICSGCCEPFWYHVSEPIIKIAKRECPHWPKSA